MAKLITIFAFILLVVNKQSSTGPSMEMATVQMFLAIVFAVALLFSVRSWVKEFIEG